MRNEDKIVYVTIGGILGIFVIGGGVALYLTINLSQADRAIVIATILGGLGTIALAIATSYNILQTSRSLRYRELEKTKPVVIDELSQVIEPAIVGLEKNANKLIRSGTDACSFDWVYIDGPTHLDSERGPHSVKYGDTRAFWRMFSNERELAAEMRAHDSYVESVSAEASKFHEQIKSEIERLLDKEGIEELNQSHKVVSTAILRETEHFGERHQLRDFWENHRDYLISYASEEIDVTSDHIQAAENVYQELLEELLKKLVQRKAELKEEYGISEEEIDIGV